ncbi:FxsA family protein [Conexibacter woesei]|uniref:FxsA cytoplasmic membrane protein n=1 Tax=Conexibacter woesei (strain DSM 14684 / CCUG 47730 / CIP 108061 / JCM 11494 / NBRC 100937 / ID131577) TaxID=469383 RepID=D3F281_CONWI|nr:FxsA family protein [Conexibacter woesei]ADB50256.1 FxsA cytoplasmic membrane protein [Conexibacter woesei DSM 14684]
MVILLLLLLLLVPIAELYVIIQVGQAIGALPTIGLLILSSVLGTVLLRAQGRLVWRRFRGALNAGRAPAREVVDGALVIFGGMLLIVPGFISDVFGLLLLLPPSRVLVRKALLSGARGRMVMTAAAVGGSVGGASRARARQDYDVDSTGHDVDGPGPQLRG